MSEEPTKGEPGSKSGFKKYIRWFFISAVMIVILYTIIMATMRKFGGA